MSHIITPPSIRESIAEYFVSGGKFDISALESILLRKPGGMDLSNLDKEHIYSMRNHYYDLVTHYVNENIDRDFDEVKKTTDKFPHILTPNAMIVKSDEELLDHALFAYQVSNFHYILGSYFDMKQSFPNSCCGRSSRNVTLSLMDHGYSNATYAYNDYYDHGYVVLPFVHTKRDMAGVILIDPTSDQSGNGTPRNLTILKFGDKWTYKIGWKYRDDLFPSHLCSIDILRTQDEDSTIDSYYQEGGEFLREAYANPVEVNITKENLFLEKKIAS